MSGPGGEGGGKIVLVEEVVHIVGGNRDAMVVGFDGTALRKACNSAT